MWSRPAPPQETLLILLDPRHVADRFRRYARSGPWARLVIAVAAALLVGVVVAFPVVIGWVAFAFALALLSVAGVQWSMRRAMQAGGPLERRRVEGP